MTLDHVTYQVNLHRPEAAELENFFNLIGLPKVSPEEDVLEAGWEVHWFEAPNGVLVHLVHAEDTPPLGLGHICVYVEQDRYAECRASEWLEHDSGSGRIWLKGPCGLRVEVRPHFQLPLGKIVTS